MNGYLQCWVACLAKHSVDGKDGMETYNVGLHRAGKRRKCCVACTFDTAQSCMNGKSIVENIRMHTW